MRREDRERNRVEGAEQLLREQLHRTKAYGVPRLRGTALAAQLRIAELERQNEALRREMRELERKLAPTLDPILVAGSAVKDAARIGNVRGELEALAAEIEKPATKNRVEAQARAGATSDPSDLSRFPAGFRAVAP